MSFSPAVGNFFGYSCVPGIKDPQHDPRGNNPKNLCEACIGDENDRHICANNHRERHYGEAGALRYNTEADSNNSTNGIQICFFYSSCLKYLHTGNIYLIRAACLKKHRDAIR